MLFAELEGRYYGGGVLELTPSEFKKLPIPYVKLSSNKFKDYVKKFKSIDDINKILIQNDKNILSQLSINEVEIEQIQELREKLVKHRIRLPVNSSP